MEGSSCSVAMMVASPSAIPVTLPFSSTAAMEVSEDDHVTVSSWLCPSGSQAAVRVIQRPALTVAASSMVMLVIGASYTAFASRSFVNVAGRRSAFPSPSISHPRKDAPSGKYSLIRFSTGACTVSAVFKGSIWRIIPST